MKSTEPIIVDCEWKWSDKYKIAYMEFKARLSDGDEYCVAAPAKREFKFEDESRMATLALARAELELENKFNPGHEINRTEFLGEFEKRLSFNVVNPMRVDIQKHRMEQNEKKAQKEN
jgi:hypothetical protein